MKIFRKKIKAYSLLEILITLAIVTIIMVMLTNVLFLTLDIARKSFARSFVREEQNNLVTKIEKDIRNARFVESCEGEGETAMCEVYLHDMFIWTTCQREGKDPYVCKKDKNGNIIEGMSEAIRLDQFSFEEGLSDSPAKKSILLTLVVSHKDSKYEINNQVRQIAISTRNYGI